MVGSHTYNQWVSLALATSLAAACADIVDGTVILHGSLALGGYRPGRSDIDLLLVTPRALAPPDVLALRELAADAPLDLHVLTAQAAARPAPAPPVELYAGHGEFTVGVPADPDVVTELSMARAAGITLIGPPPGSAIGPVPADWVRARGRHWLTVWLGLTDDTAHAAFMVLTACRMWRFAAEGVHSPKISAARWALSQDPSLSAVRAAIRQHEDDPSADVPPAEISRVLTAALACVAPGRSRRTGKRG